MGNERIRSILRVTSSYEANEFDIYFGMICYLFKPKRIVEYGIGNGYSLNSFRTHGKCGIEAYDLFDDYKYSHADYDLTRAKFKDIKIARGDFYGGHKRYADKSIDILHIDISNDGDVYEFAVKNYLPKTRIMLLEGGSHERDQVDWMIKYNKRPIRPYLESIKQSYFVIDKFPSLTIIK